jgi:hypothetical protein
MTWNGKNPNVIVIDKTYETGITLNKKIMKNYESVLERTKGIEKWFISIKPAKSIELVNMELLV